MTNDMNPLSIPDDVQQAMLNNFNHAMNALGDTIASLHEAGMEPPAMASALAAAYTRYVAALMCVNRKPVEEVLLACKDGIDTMQDFVNDIYKTTAEALAQKDAA